jgi:hypothetical protein
MRDYSPCSCRRASSGVLGRFPGFGPLVEHVPLHFVEHFGIFGVPVLAGQFEAMAARVEEVDRLEHACVGRADHLDAVGFQPALVSSSAP